jgi:AhpD family alkylhydroperoxidase
MGLVEFEKIARKTPASVTTTLPIVEENDAPADVAQTYEKYRAHFGRPDVPGILKCFATHPALAHHMLELSQSLIFADGHLTRRHKEMIATLFSSQSQCPYCADSHGYFLRVYGGSSAALLAIEHNQLSSPALTAA